MTLGNVTDILTIVAIVLYVYQWVETRIIMLKYHKYEIEDEQIGITQTQPPSAFPHEGATILSRPSDEAGAFIMRSPVKEFVDEHSDQEIKLSDVLEDDGL